VRRLSAHHHGEIAHAFARSFEFAFETGREDSLPTSSSVFSCSSTLPGTGISSSRNARAAKRKKAMPAFMSSTPGPHSRPSEARNGMVRSVPTGHTVSEWPSARICPLFFRPGSFISQTRWWPGNFFTAAMGATVSETSSTNRPSAAGSSLGDSHSTNWRI
jgi:hypothetical protein